MITFRPRPTLRPLLSLLALLMLAVPSLRAATSAADLLKRSAAKLRAMPCMQVAYTATVDGHSFQGMLIRQDRMFTISADGMHTWFDGKTQWTFSRQIGEVNIVTPTPDELQQIDPLSILTSFSTDYTARSLGDDRVELTPRSPGGDIRKADITFDSSTLYPLTIRLTMSNRQTLTIRVDHITSSGKQPVSTFRYDPKSHPGVNVVDLR